MSDRITDRNALRERIATKVVAGLCSVPERMGNTRVVHDAIDIANLMVDQLQKIHDEERRHDY